MRIRLFLPLLVLLLTACGPEGNSFRINGSFRDMQAGQLYIYNLAGTHARLDTLTVQNGRFFYEGEVSDVTPYTLVFPNGMEQVIFVGPGQEVTYEATANDLKNYVVSGSDENKLMNQFRQETHSSPPAMVVNTARTYIEDNPSSPVAVYLLDRYFIQDENISVAELAPLLTLVKKHHPHNHLLMETDGQLAYARHWDIGKKLPDVELTLADGDSTRLWPAHGSDAAVHLIFFWATWMHNGYETLWQFRRLLDTYKDDDRLRVAAISLDVEQNPWRETIRPDSSKSHLRHYCDGLSFESPAAKTLGVNRLPYYIITDRQHKILEKGNDVKDLEGLLKKHLP